MIVTITNDQPIIVPIGVVHKFKRIIAHIQHNNELHIDDDIVLSILYCDEQIIKFSDINNVVMMIYTLNGVHFVGLANVILFIYTNIRIKIIIVKNF